MSDKATEKKCNKCGVVLVPGENQAKSKGKYCSCKKCFNERRRKYQREYNKVYRDKNIEKQRKREREYAKIYRARNKEGVKKTQQAFSQSPKGRYTTYKRGAKQRGIEWNITYDEFLNFWQVDCVYCGGKVATVGLDRKDSLKGYSSDNVVSCCARCNYMKLDYTFDELLSQCSRILEYNGFKVKNSDGI